MLQERLNPASAPAPAGKTTPAATSGWKDAGDGQREKHRGMGSR